ncbi:hypothetical protein AAW14_04600 [Streptomyces hygroscopicus]|uniref:hypothetical protein n=1 Tax=Streptomyces hygroscopicus TaxID=1912 RepID=UPI0022400CD4|nr:hypothetical protein [Streptomyces hygroscopicus]MCW7941346.1 hypothetical protein [Streptomyces hygroscopicus]
MSASRTTVRLIATFVASAALVGAAALPALADGGGHDRDKGRSFSYGYRSHVVGSYHDHVGDRDRDRDGDRDRNRGWSGDRGTARLRDHFGGWDRNRGRHHGWFGDRHWHHDHHVGRR